MRGVTATLTFVRVATVFPPRAPPGWGVEGEGDAGAGASVFCQRCDRTGVARPVGGTRRRTVRYCRSENSAFGRWRPAAKAQCPLWPRTYAAALRASIGIGHHSPSNCSHTRQLYALRSHISVARARGKHDAPRRWR